LKTRTFSTSSESYALSRKYGYDEWIVERFLRYMPEVKNCLEEMEKTPRQYIRANSLKINSGGLKQRLLAKGIELEETSLPEVFEVKKSPFSIGSTLEYLLGYYYIQDLSSCLVVEAMDLCENLTVLDMASSPGGKTSFIAQKMKNTGCIVALEPNSLRLRPLIFNLSRCGVINTCVFRMDGKKSPELNIMFDRVLLDAPCTGEGIIGKDRARKISHKPEDIEACTILQMELIEAAARVVKPGGLLIYSTCSFAPEENEFVINSLIDKFDIKVEALPFGSEGLTFFAEYNFNNDMKNTRRLYPHLHNTMGFYIAKLRVNS